MMWFSHLKTVYKLVMSLGLCLAVALGVGIICLSRMARMNSTTESIISDALAGTTRLAILRGDIKEFRLFQFRHVIAQNDAAFSEL